MINSEISNHYKKEKFSLFLIAIALSACYLMISRFELILDFWNISLTLDNESRVKGYFFVSMISLAVTMLLSLWFIVSFVRRKINTKFIFLGLVIMYLLFGATSYLYGNYVVGIDVDSIIPGYIDNLFIDSIIFLFIFTPYMFFSKKSKKVFVLS